MTLKQLKIYCSVYHFLWDTLYNNILYVSKYGVEIHVGDTRLPDKLSKTEVVFVPKSPRA